MILTKQELTAIVELMVTFSESDSVNIETDDSSGIGSIVTCEIPLTVEDVTGTFKVVITDHTSW